MKLLRSNSNCVKEFNCEADIMPAIENDNVWINKQKFPLGYTGSCLNFGFDLSLHVSILKQSNSK